MKLIKDTVHGYISIPEEYCSELIDTEIFQRLRRIEQTSIRSIFLCARHDRFIHSIGTYHLGKKAIETIITNSRNFQYMWIISHHKVMYDQHILEQAIKMLGEQLSNKD